MIPHALVATMTVLALLALLVSVMTAEKISSFAAPAPGDPAIVKIFHTVVQRSLDAPSFTVDSFLSYQSPDRTATITSGTGTLVSGQKVIGQRIYLLLGTNAQGVAQWGSGPLSHQADQNYGSTRATEELKMLLGDDSVVRNGDNFTVQQMVAADVISPGNPGQILITYTVYVADDYVTGVAPFLRGWVTIPTSGVPGHLTWARVNEYRSPETTYGNYALVAPITAPPADETVPLATCAHGGYVVVQQSRRVCTLSG
jgi:hypothetical protein